MPTENDASSGEDSSYKQDKYGAGTVQEWKSGNYQNV
jgi:hypothetical protein